MILTLPAHTKLTFMDCLLTMLRSPVSTEARARHPPQVPSEGKRSPCSKSALHKGFTTFYCRLRDMHMENPRDGKGVTV
jgi:hypothetical protein